MSDANKSFFSGLHGAVTGFAAFITAVVALVGLALNQGWIGGHAKSATGTATTTPGATALPGSSPPDVVPTFTVEPSAVSFQPLGPFDATVSVKNTGPVTLTVQSPSITGIDKGRFTVTDLGCIGSLNVRDSCQMKVSFTRASGNFNATLVVRVANAPPIQVPISASAIL